MKTAIKSISAIFGFLISLSSYSQTPVYNSYPSATATIYLDFDGHFVNGTSWNYNGPITCGPANITDLQKAEVYNRVAEDYRPFNVNVTTDSTKYWAAPQFKRMRVVVTITSDWYGAAGGVSYVGSFTWGDNTPCFVFSALLGYNSKKIAEASSHEAGHTLGLNHQSSYDASCNKTEYNPGTGTGDISWAPIMGNGYSKNLTLWHNGTNSWGCSNFQDDLTIITSNGLSFRTDDFSNTTSTATDALLVNNQFSLSGVIERATDKDVIKFTMPATGNLHLDANPFSASGAASGSNLDLKINLLNQSQTVVGTYNPALLLNATIDTTLTAGTYYLEIQSMGNIYAPQYATLGSYSVSATVSPSGVLPLHRLELKGANENNNHKFNWVIEADETLIQQVLEVSTNGTSFQPVTSIETTARNYSYLPKESSLLYYRLNVQFDNNKKYFSNIVALRNTINKPYIVSNLVHNSVQVNSSSPFAYVVADINGRIVAKGNLLKGLNTINTASFSNGLYMIQYQNGQEQYSEKFMKQ